jgi:hypothetical protein
MQACRAGGLERKIFPESMTPIPCVNGSGKTQEGKISHEAFSSLKVRFFHEAMRSPISIDR